MVDSPFHELLLKQSVTRLREMLAQADEQLRRITFEREYIASALAAKQGISRREPDEASRGSAVRPGHPTTARTRDKHDRRAAIREVMESRRDAVWMPAVVTEELAARGITASVPAVRATMKSMLDEELERPDDGNGFVLASRNGSSAESNAGPTKNETGETLSTATGPQEGNQQ